MNRWKAAAVHLGISLTLATMVAALLYFVWFPSPYFIAAGAGALISLLLGVDVCVGPLLTLLIVNNRKSTKQLRLDLSVIGIIQMLALGYGLYVIAHARPVFVVARVDRLILVSADELADADLAKGRELAFRQRSWTGPVLVGAIPPSGNGGADLALQTLNTGKDIERMPAFYVPYAQAIDAVLQRGKPLSELKHLSTSQQQQLAGMKSAASLIALPLKGSASDYTAVLSQSDKKVLAVLPIDPWL